MKLSKRLYEGVEKLWTSYYEHPFVKGIGDGTLDIEKFKYYMIQDYLYLLDYSKVFALGVVKAKDEEIMRIFVGLVHSTLSSEVNIHKAYMKKLNISEEEVKEAKPALVNTAYTNYMLAVSQNEGLLQLIVAVLSCSWSYKLIAEKLNENPQAIEDEFYGPWIKGYISKEYVESNDTIIKLVDKLGENCSKEDIENLLVIFENCSRFEYEFWNMSFNLSR